MRRKLTDIDECYLLIHRKDMSVDELSVKLDMSKATIKKFLKTADVEFAKIISKSKDKPKDKDEPKRNVVTHNIHSAKQHKTKNFAILTDADAARGDGRTKAGETNKWENRIYRPK
jgi:hypothetical protein